MIRAEKCRLVYNEGTCALETFDLVINKGEKVVIVGPSGSGKTSLLKLIMGMVYPTEGTFDVLGQSIMKHQIAEIRKLRTQIGPIFQDFRLLAGRTVLDNVILGMRFLDFSQAEMKACAIEAIERVGLGHKIYHGIERLSWGECQRVAIARALSRKPKLIVADEPTGNLDEQNAINVLKLLTSLADAETTVVITTHATHLVKHVKASKVLTMNNGIEKCEVLHEDV